MVDKETELVTKAQNQRSKFQVAIDDKYWNDSLSAVHSDERNLKQTLNGQMLMAQPETMHPGSHGFTICGDIIPSVNLTMIACKMILMTSMV